jgi:hypothetical protein
MAWPKKKRILKTLSAAHLRAIGSVSAHWSLCSLRCSGQSPETQHQPTEHITLVGSQGVDAWAAMLVAFTGHSARGVRGMRPTKLEEILGELTELKWKRNEVVHAGSYERRGIIAAQMRPTATQHAKGFGIKKRGTALLVDIEMNSADMLGITSRIEVLERSISEWVSAPLPENQASVC